MQTSMSQVAAPLAAQKTNLHLKARMRQKMNLLSLPLERLKEGLETLLADNPIVEQISNSSTVPLSSLAPQEHNNDSPADHELDFTPGRDDTEVDRELLEEMNRKPDTKLTTIGTRYVPASLSEAIGERAGVTDLRASSITKQGRKDYVKNLKHLHMTIEKQPAFETAYVTRGGVELTSIDRKTYGSRHQEGMYIIGEVLDIDGISGGYNLQAAISEAYIAVSDIMC